MPAPKRVSVIERALGYVGELADVYDGIVKEMRTRQAFGTPDGPLSQPNGNVTPFLAMDVAKTIWYRAALEGAKRGGNAP